MPQDHDLVWRPERLRCERLAAPNAIGTAGPAFSWCLPVAAAGDAQAAYQLAVATTSERAGAERGHLGQRLGRVASHEGALPWASAGIPAISVLVGPSEDGLGGDERVEPGRPFRSGAAPSERLDRDMGGSPSCSRRLTEASRVPRAPPFQPQARPRPALGLSSVLWVPTSCG